MRRGQRRRAAFTFVEVFAALIFLAILVPAIVEGLKVASKSSELAERGAIAGELAENKLNEILVDGSNGNDAGLSNNGDFGPEWPGYRWQVSESPWTADSLNTMTDMSVQVFYPVQGKEQSFTLDTLISSGTASSSGSGQTTP